MGCSQENLTFRWQEGPRLVASGPARGVWQMSPALQGKSKEEEDSETACEEGRIEDCCLNGYKNKGGGVRRTLGMLVLVAGGTAEPTQVLEATRLPGRGPAAGG